VFPKGGSKKRSCIAWGGDEAKQRGKGQYVLQRRRERQRQEYSSFGLIRGGLRKGAVCQKKGSAEDPSSALKEAVEGLRSEVVP